MPKCLVFRGKVNFIVQLISGDKFCIQIIKTNLDSQIVYQNVKLHLTYEFSCIKIRNRFG